jgi:hypothetical protein
MSSLPTYTAEEETDYNNLITLACKELKIGESFNFPHEKNDERSRMLWFFLAKEIKEKPELIEKYEDGILKWKKEFENDHWISNWTNLINEMKSGNYEILYEKSDLMQQLRSKSPRAGHFLEDKMRKKVLDKISEINNNSNFGITNERKQKI